MIRNDRLQKRVSFRRIDLQPTADLRQALAHADQAKAAYTGPEPSRVRSLMPLPKSSTVSRMRPPSSLCRVRRITAVVLPEWRATLVSASWTTRKTTSSLSFASRPMFSPIFRSTPGCRCAPRSPRGNSAGRGRDPPHRDRGVEKVREYGVSDQVKTLPIAAHFVGKLLRIRSVSSRNRQRGSEGS